MAPRRSSRLLFEERPLIIRPTLAVAVGLNEAVFLQQLHYWITETHSGKDVDGRRWVYNTYDEWLKQFPFWSLATLRRVIASLEQNSYVLSTSTLNDHPSNRTKWYTIDYDALEALADRLPDPADQSLKMSSPSNQQEQMDVRNVSGRPAHADQVDQRNVSDSSLETETTHETTSENTQDGAKTFVFLSSTIDGMEAASIWGAVLDDMASDGDVKATDLSGFIKPAKLLGARPDGTLVLQAATAPAHRRIEAHLRSDVERALSRWLGRSVKIEVTT